MPIPRQPAPALSVDTLRNGGFDLAGAAPERATLVCFYRGLHCPICTGYLKDLERHVDEFAKRGVETIAISADARDRAEAMAEKVGAEKLRVGYGLPLPVAREWGLYISTSRGKTSAGVEEPELFFEPGLFLIQKDGTTYYASTQSMPFARPSFRELLGAVDFVIEKDYPARGEHAGPV